MKIEDLAEAMGKTRKEVEEILDKQEVIELNLSERKPKRIEEDNFIVYW